MTENRLEPEKSTLTRAKRATTVRDVASECGISHQTVSNVLNNRGSFSEATRAKVLEAVGRLNYRPNPIARGLNRMPMNAFGVVLPNAFEAPTSHPYFAYVLDGVMRAAVELRVDVMTYTGSLWAEDGPDAVSFHEGRTDGLILVAPLVRSPLIHELSAAGVKFVCISDYIDDPNVACVFIDDEQSERVLVEYLLEIGHRRIAMLRGDDYVRCVARRAEGYGHALEAQGIRVTDELDVVAAFSGAPIRQGVEQLMNLPADRRPTAICATTDAMAVAAIAALDAIGMRVPEDVSVVGFDDTADATSSQLTTMRQPIRAMAHRAAHILAGMLSGEIAGAPKERFDTELVIRGSTAPVCPTPCTDERVG